MEFGESLISVDGQVKVSSLAGPPRGGGVRRGNLPRGPYLIGAPKMFELYVFDATKIKDSDITDGSWVRAMVTALKMQRNSVSERWSPKRETGAPNKFRKGPHQLHNYVTDLWLHIWRHQGPQIDILPRAPQNLSAALITGEWMDD